MREARLITIVRHMIEESVRVRIGQWAVLAPCLHVVAALNEIEAALISPIGSRIETALSIERNTKRIATTLGEDFELVGVRLVPPDCLPQKMDATHGRSACASL